LTKLCTILISDMALNGLDDFVFGQTENNLISILNKYKFIKIRG